MSGGFVEDFGFDFGFDVVWECVYDFGEAEGGEAEEGIGVGDSFGFGELGDTGDDYWVL